MSATETQTPITENLERLAVVVADLEARGFTELYATAHKREASVSFSRLDDFKAALKGCECSVTKALHNTVYRVHVDGVEFRHDSWVGIGVEAIRETVTL